MQRENWILSFPVELAVFGSIFTVASVVCKYSVIYPYRAFILPQVIGRWGYPYPRLVVFYGFPEPWFVQVWGIVFPHGGAFSRYDFLVQGFVSDVLCYSLILSPFLFVSRWMKWDRERAFQKLPND